MTLVDRYLHAVRFFLPRREQDDIVRELSENLASEIEERSEALDRELSEKELADILRRHGHPIVVAARYAPRRQLIGPVWFPIYLLALKLGLGAALAVTVVVSIVGAAWRGGSVPHFVDEANSGALVTRVVDLQHANPGAIINRGELIQPLPCAGNPLEELDVELEHRRRHAGARGHDMGPFQSGRGALAGAALPDLRR